MFDFIERERPTTRWPDMPSAAGLEQRLPRLAEVATVRARKTEDGRLRELISAIHVRSRGS